MTVVHIPGEGTHEKWIRCFWFDGGELLKGEFHQDTLTLIPKEEL